MKHNRNITIGDRDEGLTREEIVKDKIEFIKRTLKGKGMSKAMKEKLTSQRDSLLKELAKK